jgi:type II secretory pathway pseudopilin PulG
MTAFPNWLMATRGAKEDRKMAVEMMIISRSTTAARTALAAKPVTIGRVASKEEALAKTQNLISSSSMRAPPCIPLPYL